MSKKIVNNYGKSVRSKLLNIAKSEGIYYQTVLTRYFQERLIEWHRHPIDGISI